MSNQEENILVHVLTPRFNTNSARRHVLELVRLIDFVDLGNEGSRQVFHAAMTVIIQSLYEDHGDIKVALWLNSRDIRPCPMMCYLKVGIDVHVVFKLRRTLNTEIGSDKFEIHETVDILFRDESEYSPGLVMLLKIFE